MSDSPLAGPVQGVQVAGGLAMDVVRAQDVAAVVAAERLRIARELHDTVGHAMTVILLQAAGAARLMDVDPQAARAAISLLESAGQEALVEMRRMVGVLRAGADPVPAAPAQIAAASTQVTAAPAQVAAIPQLVARVAAAGVRVAIASDGDRGALTPAAELAAYRVVQEALTNTVRHGGPDSTAQVRLAWQSDRLTVEVTDELTVQVTDEPVAEPSGTVMSGGGVSAGPGGAARPGGAAVVSSGGGNGLRGLAERVQLVGGRFESGPVGVGGFRVSAALPLA